MDWKTLLAPFVGAAAAYLAAHGLALTADQQAAAITIVSGALTALAHWFDSRSTPTLPPPAAGTTKQGGFSRLPMLLTVAVLALATAPLATLPGCQSLGLAPAQSFDQKLAYAYGVYTAVNQAAASATSAGSLSKADATQVLNFTDQARALLDGARAVEATDPNGAQNKLLLATSVLTQVQSYLQSRGIK